MVDESERVAAYACFSRADRELVKKVQDALSPDIDLGLIDYAGFDLREDWESRVNDAITSAAALVFFASEAALGSPLCLAELDKAVELGIPRIAASLEPVDVPESVSGVHVDLGPSADFERAIEQLREAFRRVSGESEQRSVGLELISSKGEVWIWDMTPELRELIAEAHGLTASYDDTYDLAFTGTLLAFDRAKDPLSGWFQDYVSASKVQLDSLSRQVNTSSTPAPRNLHGPMKLTTSATHIFAAARKFGGDEPRDVRHLLAAYIYSPGDHEKQLTDAGFDRADWSEAFLFFVLEHHPDEIPVWRRLHQQEFPDHPVILPQLEGPSAHIARDLWTTDDRLGYDAYAYAIASFLTHSETAPPLTISIQAPWGGGKTSLMRMIQEEIDPEGVKKAKAQDPAHLDRDEMTLGGALKEIGRWIRRRTSLPAVPLDAGQRLTVWFNAWKYQSTNQVWAGLVDSLVKQVAIRLKPLDRERFYLRLHLDRIDPDKVRRRVYGLLAAAGFRLAKHAVLPVLVSGLGFIVSKSLGLLTTVGFGLGLGSISLAGAIGALAAFFVGGLKARKEPASVSLADYLSVPDYAQELGFIHHVEADVRRVLRSVPKEHRPIVLFIDDLDRCSPDKVAQVMEAVNLFLAGDFPYCMFVLGMDAEMVAAALQVAHGQITEQLPESAASPIGWRFMDKFVQLPVILPGAARERVEAYLDSLLSTGTPREERDEAADLVKLAAPVTTTPAEIDREVGKIEEEHGAAAAQQAKRVLERATMQREFDQRARAFRDDNPDIQALILEASRYFRSNPRALKRFVNSFRFHYFLFSARKVRRQPTPTLDQLQRWVVLSLKWPDAARWLRRAREAGKEEHPRLKVLEEMGGHVEADEQWDECARRMLHLDPDRTRWVRDPGLRRFFRSECARDENRRLSAGIGRGFW